MNSKSIIALVAISMFLLFHCSSCKERTTEQVAPSHSTILEIQSHKASMRAGETSWDNGDKIGVYAVESGKGLSTTTLYKGASNLCYTTPNGDGFFTIANGSDVQLEQGQRIDLISYYPYQPVGADHKLRVNVSDQSDLAKLDLLYSDNAMGINARHPKVNLQFDHAMALLQVSVMTEEEGIDLTELKITLDKVITEGVFDLSSGDFSNMGPTTASVVMHNTTSVPGGAMRQALLLPAQELKGLTYHFEVGDKSYTFVETEAKQLAAGVRARRNFKLSSSGVELINATIEIIDQGGDQPTPDEPSDEFTTKAYYKEQVLVRKGYMEDLIIQQHDAPDSWFGGGTTPGGKRRNYTIYYSKNNYQPYMIAYPLYNDCVGNSGRTDAWDYDPELPKMYQMNLTSAYVSGYSRGHMLASNQRTATKSLNKTTFYFSNMVPQNQNQNAGIWNQLENQENNWAKRVAPSDTMYVVCGPIISPNNGTVTDRDKEKQCPIPTHTWKVLLKKKGSSWISIGVRMPNETQGKGTKWYEYACTVAELEQELGVVFFPQLSEIEAASVKRQNNWSEW